MGWRFYATLGNTSLHTAAWDGQWHHLRQSAVTADTLADWSEIIRNFCHEVEINPEHCEGAFVCLSRPLPPHFTSAISSILNVPVRFFPHDISSPLKIAYDEPSTIGADRILVGYAGFRTIKGPCIVIDAGSCITCDAVTDDGWLLPIAIAPGLRILQVGLHQVTPHLSEALGHALKAGVTTSPVAPRGTADCLQAGIKAALSGTVRELITIAQQRFETSVPILITGGDGALVASLLNMCDAVYPILALEGLRYLDELN